MGDLHIVQVNHVGSSIFPIGARCYVISQKDVNTEVYGRSRSGRWVTIWERSKKLYNPRIKTIPPEHSQYKHLSIYAPKAEWIWGMTERWIQKDVK